MAKSRWVPVSFLPKCAMLTVSVWDNPHWVTPSDVAYRFNKSLSRLEVFYPNGRSVVR